MTIVLRRVTREAAEAILAGERPRDVRVADDYPTEFSAGTAEAALGADERQVGCFFVQRSEDDVVVGEIGAAFIDDAGTVEIGYAVVESQRGRGYATAAVEAVVAELREAPQARRVVAHTPLDRPESARVVEKAGFAMVGEVDDVDEVGNTLRVKEWELTLYQRTAKGGARCPSTRPQLARSGRPLATTLRSSRPSTPSSPGE